MPNFLPVNLILATKTTKTLASLLVFLLFCSFPQLSKASQANISRLVIIIDDVGNNKQYGQQTVELPGRITLAFLPHTPFAKRLAKQAYAQGKEVMLHQPMANESQAALGPGALTAELSESEFKKILNYNIASIPHLSGLNNHMGSALTTQQQAMNWTMQVSKQHQLYFVDSLTNANSVAQQTAQQYQIKNLKRHVFLDHEKSQEFIDGQFKQAIKIAKQYGVAVLIGHPYPETLSYLQQALTELTATDSVQQVQLATPSDILYPTVSQHWQNFNHEKNSQPSIYQLGVEGF